jgi:hypothetical protein
MTTIDTLCAGKKPTIGWTTVNGNIAYDAKYSGYTCLPNNGTGFSQSADFNSNGTVKTSALDNQINIILAAKSATVPVESSITPDDAGVAQAKLFATNAKAVRDALLAEYCYYSACYLFALEMLLDAASNVNTDSSNAIIYNIDGTISASSEIYRGSNPHKTYGSITTSGTTVTATGLMGDVYNLNSKLNQLIQLIQRLQVKRYADLNTNFYTAFSASDSTSLNDMLLQTKTNLMAQSDKLKNGDFEMNVKQAMIDYTLEKNSSSRNLLAVYGFMNIVAVGLLFYMYKASK